MPGSVFRDPLQRRRPRQRHRDGGATRRRWPRLGQGSLGPPPSFRAGVSPGLEARTIADLDGAGEVGRLHLAEALTYRIDTARSCAPR